LTPKYKLQEKLQVSIWVVAGYQETPGRHVIFLKSQKGQASKV